MKPKTIRPRAPEACELDLPGGAQPLQVNHCRQPDCANFGVPARTEPGKTGPSADRGMNYKVHSTEGASAQAEQAEGAEGSHAKGCLP